MAADLPLASFGRRFGAVFGLGLAGVAARAATLPARLATIEWPEPLAALSPAALLALSLLNPLLLLLLASLVGAACAHRVGLHSAAAGTASWPAPRDWLMAAASGIALALVIATLDFAWSRAVQGHWAQAGGAAAATTPQLLLGMLYGGLTEEVLLRWA